MAKQLELRRGTTQANNLFTGAAGEVTMDTDTKQLRVHDGVKTGGYAIDTLVDFQAPSAGNNYTWYRKYSSGWVEQGGNVTATSDASYNVALPVTMANNKYTVFVTRDNGSQEHGEGSINARWCEVWSRTTSSFYTWGIYGDSTDFSWQVSGMAA